MVYGVGRGISEWAGWELHRKPIKLTKQFKWIEPIVNATKDCGYGAWFVLACAGSSGFVTATFPISVPVIAYFFAEPEEEAKPKKAQQQPLPQQEEEEEPVYRRRRQY